jgi:tetratricopeptide (TPR) repeat protein
MFWVCLGIADLAAHPAGQVEEGLRLLHLGRLEEAEAELRKARFQNPDDSRLSYNLGIIQYRKRQYQDALNEWQRALSSCYDPALRADLLHNLGNAAYRTQTYDVAVSAYQGALDLNEQELTRFNLEQARKKLEEQQREQQKQQQKQDQQNQQQNPDSQDQNQKDQSGKQNQQQQGNQQNAQNQDKGQNQNKPGEDGKSGDAAKDGEKNAQKQPGAPENQTGSDTAKAGDDKDNGTNEGKDEERKDVQMGQDKEQQKPLPETSQRAKGLKNQKLNPYLVEKLLKDMEEHEKEMQLRYRNDPNRRDEQDEMMDPFFMDADQLRDFMERRHKKRPAQSQPDTPDW